ncbi:MAG: response regulator transcription factor [Chloroflexota bacterium]|nr:MAG: response regulator transcription factor [Chloroflexota bacterium]
MVSSVLVIDHDVALTEVLRGKLESDAFDIYTAEKIEDATDAIQRYSPDVVVIDLPLGEKDGWQVFQDIRSKCKIPILILSVLNDPSAIARALDLGADDYLIKPVPNNVLTAHVKNLIRRAHAEQIAQNSRFDL